MKKIYTTTVHNANNYGAVLQAYALQQVLSHKYDTKILNYDNKIIRNEYRCFKKRKGIKAQAIQIAKDIISCNAECQHSHNFKKFRKVYFQETQRFINAQDIIRNYPKADAYITGSDQVWNPKITKGFDPIYMLNFGNNDFKKISYAASAGNNSALGDNVNKLTQYLHSFDTLLVREEPLRDLLVSNGFNDVKIVVDPTLLLTTTEWQKLIPKTPDKKNKYIVAYSWKEPQFFLDIINDFAKKNNYKIYYFHRRDLKHAFHGKRESFYTYGPNDFLKLIKNADYIFTNSFHGTVFSLIFNKKFFVAPTNYFDRIETLLKSRKSTNPHYYK